MAQKVQTLFVDDLDGSEAEELSVSDWTAPTTRLT